MVLVHFLCILCVIIMLLFDDVNVNGVKIRNLKVPEAVRINHSVTLNCLYDLENEALYSIKWYREHEEFYRYVPKEEPPTRIFSIPDLNVDISESNANEVKLLNVKRSLSGIYQCEVSADAPFFHTAIQSASMTVVELPIGLPIIAINRNQFETNGPLIATCEAPPSNPAPNLTWYVNEQKVPGSTFSEIKNISEYELASSQLQLFNADKSSGPKLIQLRCEADVFHIYHISSAEVEIDLGDQLITDEPVHILLMENQQKTNSGTYHTYAININIILMCLVCTLYSRS